ncbi:MAG: bifunctional 2-polyprenyl-6-hydroxyphenol methylase/3-demethylubiquinol 3-O-methyltransferase UbiG [Pseudomonadota bacterium]
MTETETMQDVTNVDAEEVEKFDALAATWWDPAGPSRPLHALNPVRLSFVAGHAGLEGSRCLDVGCGGGLLSEALVKAGAEVTAIDRSEKALQVARLHRHESGVEVDYRLSTAEALAQEVRDGAEAPYDSVTCMEMLEHVPDPRSVIQACADLLNPGGWFFASTLNRTPRAFALGIVAAEYILGLLPRGTHEYARFIRPSELTRAARACGLGLVDIRGLSYNPLRDTARLVDDPSVNYVAAFRKPA